MNLHTISTIKDTNKNLIGVRVLDSDNNKIKDVKSSSLIKNIQNGLTVCGVCVQDGVLKGTNGSLDRYPQIINGKAKNENTLIILNKIELNGETVGYTVSNYIGTIKTLKLEEAIILLGDNKIANGMVRAPETKKKHISSISGEHNKIEVAKAKQDEGWGIEEFEKFMDSNNHKHKITGSKLILHKYREEELNIPKGITRVEVSKMSGDKLQRVIIPATLLTIVGLFRININLREIVFLDGREIIHGKKLGINEYEFPNLRSIKWPKTLKCIADFDIKCSLISEINFPSGLASITNSFNSRKNKFKNVKLPDSVISVHSSFLNCKDDLVINSPKKVSNVKFNWNAGDTVLKEDITDIDNYSFAYHNQEGKMIHGVKTSNIAVQGKVRRIGDFAFSNMKGLTGFEVLKSDELRYIGDFAFNGCEKLIDATFNELRVLERVGDYAFFTADRSETSRIAKPTIREMDLSCVIGSLSIGIGAFSDTGLRIIKFPQSCKNLKIGKNAFSQTLIDEFILPEGITELEENVLFNCPRLEILLLPRSIESIHKAALRTIYSGVLKVVVYKGSKAEQICKEQNIKTVIIRNIKDLEEVKLENKHVDDTKITLTRVLMGTESKHRELLEDKYVASAAEACRIYKLLTDDNFLSSRSCSIKDDSLINIMLHNTPTMEKHLNWATSGQRDAVGHKFNALSNLITSRLGINKDLTSWKGLRYLDDFSSLDGMRVMYSASDGKIVVLNKNDAISDYRIVVGIKDSSIVFISTFEDKHDDYVSNLFRKVKIPGETTDSIIKYLNVGDRITNSGRGHIKINNKAVTLPNYIEKEIWDNIYTNCVETHKVNIKLKESELNKDYSMGCLEYIEQGLLCCSTGIFVKSIIERGSVLSADSKTSMKSITITEKIDLNTESNYRNWGDLIEVESATKYFRDKIKEARA